MNIENIAIQSHRRTVNQVTTPKEHDKSVQAANLSDVGSEQGVIDTNRINIFR